MKPGAVFIDASRGTVDEIEPSAKALKQRKLLGAAIDVFPVKPRSNKDGLSPHPGKHRLLHIHRNGPGVLSEINRVFGDNGINISSQFLQTNDAVGHVVIDIDAAHSDVALAKLHDVPGTIRSRVLF